MDAHGNIIVTVLFKDLIHLSCGPNAAESMYHMAADLQINFKREVITIWRTYNLVPWNGQDTGRGPGGSKRLRQEEVRTRTPMFHMGWQGLTDWLLRQGGHGWGVLCFGQCIKLFLQWCVSHCSYTHSDIWGINIAGVRVIIFQVQHNPRTVIWRTMKYSPAKRSWYFHREPDHHILEDLTF